MIDVDAALRALSLEEQCRLLVGRTNWRTHAFPHAGIPELKLSDGPSGVRGEGSGADATPGVVVPAGITLGASWDVGLLERVGDLLGRECVRRRAHVLLGPTINLHRTPVGGRTFECFSEDPELSGRLAAAYVRGVQGHDVAVTVKHFVCNDTEIERMTVDVQADDRTLREVYLRPFELAVRDGDAWGVMSAYNRLHGAHCADNEWLLTSVLRDEWGFDGVVVSDWFGAHSTAASALAGLTLEMPAPARVYGARLAAAVAEGEVPAERVGALAREVLELANRTRADERSADDREESVDDPAERALTREAAIAGTVLLRNDRLDDGRPVLPLDPERLGTVAVIGPNAVVDRSMGGGSASLRPFAYRTFLDALTERVPASNVVFAEGVRIERLTSVVRAGQATTPDGRPGLLVEYVNGDDPDAPAAVTATSPSGLIRFFGTLPEGVDPRRFGARVSTTFVSEVDGDHVIGIVSTGGAILTATLGGVEHVVLDDPGRTLPRTEEFFGYGHDEVTMTLPLRAGEHVELRARWTNHGDRGFAALRIGVRQPEPADLLERAVAAAAGADAAIVVVGTNDEWETEGFDRTSMDLPGRQAELIERVVAANPRTIVIVNAGSPVTTDWAAPGHPRPAPAILVPFFAGQEQAEALVDIVLGAARPGGRLPITFPRRLQDTPAFLDHRPDRASDGSCVQRYDEGLFVGHRWYEARDLAPAFWFGHGLGYASADWGPIEVDHRTIDVSALASGASVRVSLALTAAVGRHPADEVVQVYVAAQDPSARRPPRSLAGFAKAVVAPGATVEVTVELGFDAFRRWDVPSSAWVVDPGSYDLVVARSADPAAEHGRSRLVVE